MLIAVTRPVSPTLAQCELTHLSRKPIDVARAVGQHAAYEQALRTAGAEVVRVPEALDLPDAVFVEDTAVVLPEIAVIARPGSAIRQTETPEVRTVLAAYRPILSLRPPATLDGGDVLQAGRTIFVGWSTRTNRAGIEQFERALAPFDYDVRLIEFTGCLHLKSAVTCVGDRQLLYNPAWVSSNAFRLFDAYPIDVHEPYAANALSIGGRLIYPVHFPRTSHLLTERGFDVISIEYSEFAKAEGAVTCCSLVFESTSRRA